MDAVRSLREEMSLTQAQFATRVGKSVSTVFRYETIRPPSGTVLAALRALAMTIGRHDLGKIFERAYEVELHAPTGVPSAGPLMDPERTHEIDNALKLAKLDPQWTLYEPSTLATEVSPDVPNWDAIHEVIPQGQVEIDLVRGILVTLRRLDPPTRRIFVVTLKAMIVGFRDADSTEHDTK